MFTHSSKTDSGKTHSDKTQSVSARQEETKTLSSDSLRGVSADPGFLVSPQSILQLQQRIGNRAVIQLLKSQFQTTNQFKPPIQKKKDLVPDHRENNTGMPDNLKTGLEALSGLDLSDVRVHRNSDKPAQVSALAYTQGPDIYIAPGQEQHLPHEAWHAVQQKQGRVQATTQTAGVPVNDERKLEYEADRMGRRAETKHSKLEGSRMIQLIQPKQAVIQKNRGKKVSVEGMLPWFWFESLEAKWKTHNVPIHKCHKTHVGQNQLVGGYTVIDEDGRYKASGVYGAYEPKGGKKEVGHVEHQLMDDMEGSLINDMEDDKTFGDDVLALVEIHQWFTPCSGAKGCTTFLDDKVTELNDMYEEVSAGARLSAENLYSGQLSETHPKHSKAKGRIEDIDESEPMDIDQETPMVMHNNPTTWG